MKWLRKLKQKTKSYRVQNKGLFYEENPHHDPEYRKMVKEMWETDIVQLLIDSYNLVNLDEQGKNIT